MIYLEAMAQVANRNHKAARRPMWPPKVMVIAAGMAQSYAIIGQDGYPPAGHKYTASPEDQLATDWTVTDLPVVNKFTVVESQPIKG